MSYQTWKPTVLGTKVGNGECVALVVNNPRSYTAALFPGISWTSIMAPITGARELAGKSNQHLTWIANDHNDPNQVPVQGDIMVFDKTPMAGYTNTFNNPFGHTGVCDSASASGYALFQQNAPYVGAPANVTSYPWRFRPCMGWYRPAGAPTPPPQPPAPTGKTIFLPPTTGPWHAYPPNGPYVITPSTPLLWPSFFGGLYYTIVADHGGGIYVINTQMFGQRSIYTKGSDVTIS